jgi:hypothetical protein
MSHWRCKLLVSLVLASQSASAAEPTASHSTPQLVAPAPALLPTVGREASAAASSSGWLSVFHNPARRVVGRLIAADGEPSGAPFVISADERATLARVAFDGTHYVVAWLDLADDGASSLRVQRVDTHGALVGAREQLPPFPQQRTPTLTMASGPQGVVIVLCAADDLHSTCRAWPALPGGLGSAQPMAVDDVVIASDSAFSGSQLLVALETQHDGLQLLRASAGGQFIDGAAIALNSGAQLEVAPAIAATSAGFAVVWADEQSERLSQVGFDGSVTTDPAPLIDTRTLSQPQVIALPDRFLLVGSETQDCADCAATSHIREYSSEWRLQAEPIVIDEQLTFSRASLSPNGNELLSLWENLEGQIVALRWDASDITIPPDRRLVSVHAPLQGVPVAAPGPGGWLVAWPEDYFVRASLLDAAGLPRGDVLTLGKTSENVRPWIAEVSGGPGGWLVIWDGGPPAQAVLVDGAGTIGKKVELDSYGRVQAVPASGGWTVAFNEADPAENTFAVATKHLSVDGELSPSLVLSEPYDSYQIPFDIALIPGGYRAWWRAGSSFVAKDVSTTGIAPVALPDYDVIESRSLSAAMTADGSALVWWSSLGHHFATSTSAATALVSGVAASELVDVNGTTATVWHRHATGIAEIALLQDDGEPLVVDAVDAALAPQLSGAVGNQLLLTFVR